MSQQSIKAALTRHGQLSAAQIGDRIKLGPSSVSAQLKALRDKREIHVAGWLKFNGTGPGRSAPIYAIGNAPDVPYTTRGKRELAKAPPKPTKVCEYAEVRRQAGMWGGLVCSA